MAMTRKCGQACLVIAAVLMTAGAAAAWGDKGHRIIPELALKLLPAEVPVLRERAAQVVDAGPEPDRWRSGNQAIDDAQAPDHFINLEMVDFLKALPATRHAYIEAIYAHVASTGKRLRPQEAGYQPYVVTEVFERLRLGFADYAQRRRLKQPTGEVEARIAFYAGWLSHYVADASQPLHTTIHHDGWLGDNPRGFATGRGIHSRFESGFVEENVTAADVEAVEARRPPVEDILVDYTAYVRAGHRQVEPLYELDKSSAFRGRGTPQGRKFVAERLAAGRDMLAAVWLAAWRQSGWEGCLPFTEAPSKAGQFGCLTGTVVVVNPGSGSRAPVWLNFCQDYRKCALSVQINGQERGRFPAPDTFRGKRVRVHGLVAVDEGRATVYLREPELIEVVSDQ